MQESPPNKEYVSRAIRNSFGNKRVLVVGDIMLDRYLWGSADRISPEAPTPVIRQRRESCRAGGAGNVALNLAGLGLDVAIAGFVGNDESHDRLQEIFRSRGIDMSAVVTLADRPTITKTRVIAGHQHVLRFDTEVLSDIDSRDCKFLSESVLESVDVDAIVLSDYAKGTLSASLCQRIMAAAGHKSIPVLVNPKGKDFAKYTGATVLTPNLSELSQAGGVAVGDIDGLVRVAKEFVTDLQLQFIVLTRGADGTTLVAKDEIVHAPAKAKEVFDASGVADTVIATVAATTLGRFDYADMLYLVNLAAGVVIGKVGTAVIDQSSLLRALQSEGRATCEIVRSAADLLPMVEAWRSRKQRIVYMQDRFDGVYANDVNRLQDAALEGDKLIVGIAADLLPESPTDSLRNDQNDRAAVVAALAPVDAVILCNDDIPREVLRTLQPDILLRNKDDSGDCADITADVESYGGRVKWLTNAKRPAIRETAE